jgi:tyrosine-specific transport protein
MKTTRLIIIFLSTTFFITGSLIGAGILGLPIEAGLLGFFPTMVVIIVIGAGMLFCSLLLARKSIASCDENFNFPSLYEEELGKIGKWIAIIANLFILYGLLVAYLAGITATVADIFNISGNTAWLLMILFFVMAFGSIFGMRLVSEYNAPLVLFLCITFVFLCWVGFKHVDVSRLQHAKWPFMPLIAPVILTSFYFQNLIPDIAKNLQWKTSWIFSAIFIGILLCAVMNIAWSGIGIGVLPYSEGKNSIVYAFQHQLPANIPMRNIIHSGFFRFCATTFALLAIVTSFMAQSVSLLSFNKDLLTNHFKVNSRVLCLIISFAPPLICTLINPNIFISAVNITGGIGIVILFGILPCVLAILSKLPICYKIFGWLFLIIFSLALFVTVAVQTHLIHVSLPIVS